MPVCRHLGLQRWRCGYVGQENGDGVQVIDTVTNRCVAATPAGHLSLALAYAPNAVASGGGTPNLTPAGVAGRARDESWN